ncbi:MAG: hypothetical protein ABI837_05155 [Acidobacteriota bacterium]
MKKSAILLAFVLLSAAPAFAQNQQFGILLGGSKRLYSHGDDKLNPNLPSDNFKFGSSVKEVYYGVILEPDTMFKIKLGQINGKVGAVEAPGVGFSGVPVEGKIEHVEGIIDYRFHEPFGSTGIFAGVGLYRADQNNGGTDTNYGFNAGVNGDFPMSRRYGVVVEGTYHWINLPYRPRLLTVTGGLRVSF